jgi:hypothetical protein
MRFARQSMLGGTAYFCCLLGQRPELGHQNVLRVEGVALPQS